MKIHPVDSKGAVLLLAVALPDKFKHQRDLWFNPTRRDNFFFRLRRRIIEIRLTTNLKEIEKKKTKIKTTKKKTIK